MGYKIYCIIADANDGTDRFLCYVGSTRTSPSVRLRKHLYDCRQYRAAKSQYLSSCEVVGCDWFEMKILIDLGNVSRSEAEKKEAEYIKAYQSDPMYVVVNIRNPNRTQSEYYSDNIDRIKTLKATHYRSHNSNKLVCECGGHYRKQNIKNHLITDKHKSYLNAPSPGTQ